MNFDIVLWDFTSILKAIIVLLYYTSTVALPKEYDLAYQTNEHPL